MKKIFSLLALCALAQASHAQTPIKAGTLQLGGAVNYTTSSEEITVKTGSISNTTKYTTNSLTLNPYLGLFVANNLALGVNFSYTAANSYSNVGTTTTTTPTTRLRVGPFVQYYKMVTDQFGLVGTLAGGYENDFQPGIGAQGTNITTDGAYVGLTPSIVFFPIPKLSFGASIGSLAYTHLTVKPDKAADGYGDTISSFGAGFGLSQLLFSGTFYFGR
ncbi:hypothetical protein [Hymenobacter cheonanensis]|uniref:hypothetical protein n=1 Tax=Hymenobacter sp. CA2-7 TaxID=3063993 RepID=UPI002712277C|nr:hypothetical protein [Hymenobacter sp. CA2-7]MDO7884607.1 hypothetical protein [Hymenobacter sp. CA2-7]